MTDSGPCQSHGGSPRSPADASPRRDHLLTHPGSPGLFAMEVAALVLLALCWAVLLQPLPFSDWQYYWKASTDLGAYQRGGVLLFAFSAFKLAGLPPHLAALIPNLGLAVALLFLARRLDTGRPALLAHLVAFYLLLLAPFLAVVQLDLLGTGTLLLAIVLSVRSADAARPWWYLIPAFLLAVAAVSGRPQLALTVTAFLFILGCFAISRTRVVNGTPYRRLVAVLLTGAVLGISLDLSMRSLAGNSDAVRGVSGVTLYAGLLVAEPGPYCGHWSPEAAAAAREDMDEPLVQAIRERLTARSVAHWLSVLRCKTRHIVAPSPYAYAWAVSAPNVQSYLGSTERPSWVPAAARLYRLLEAAGHFTALFLVYLAVAITAWRGRARWPVAAIPAAWIASFWAVHLVFEVQARYFLPAQLIPPFLCMVVTRWVSGQKPAAPAGSATSTA